MNATETKPVDETTEEAMSVPAQPPAEDVFAESTGSALTTLGTIKEKIKIGLKAKGMPSAVYAFILADKPTEEWLEQHGNPVLVEGTPIIGQKDGQIMYNFRGQPVVRGHECRMGGNLFLPKASFTVKPALKEAYVTAKKEQADQRAKNAKTLSQDEKDEAGESTE